MDGLCACGNLLLYLWPNLLLPGIGSVLASDLTLELAKVQNVVVLLFLVVILIFTAVLILLFFVDDLLDDAVVGQVGCPRVALRVILGRCQSDIALIVGPDGEWVPISNKYPLSDVKLARVDDQWIFDVLLDDHPAPAFLDGFDDSIVFAVDGDAAATRPLAWLDDPDVVLAVDLRLRKSFSEHAKRLTDIGDSIFLIHLLFVVCDKILHPLILEQFVGLRNDLLLRHLDDFPLIVGD